MILAPPAAAPLYLSMRIVAVVFLTTAEKK
jgi:hypothetical protein